MLGIGPTEIILLALLLVTAFAAKSWRFNLRDLLIAVTIVAVSLGAYAALLKN